MKKIIRLFSSLFKFMLSCFLVLCPISSTYAATFGDFETTGKAFILYNAKEEKVLAEENADEKLPIASLTKLMVAIVILENSDLTLEDEIKISGDMLYDLAEWSAIGLKVGDSATVEELLYALLLPSAGDAGQALAIADAGSIEAFATKMNQKASELGLTNSHFTNPIGRDTDNYSTARDIATLLFHSLKNPTFRTFFSADSYYFSPLNRTLKKTTTTYGIGTSVLSGSKTGFTNAAGRCLASTATVSDVDYLLVTLGHNSSPQHLVDSLNIYNYFGENFSYRDILKKDQALLEIPIIDGESVSYKVKAPESASYYMENSYNLENLEVSISHPEFITRYSDSSLEVAKVSIKKDDEIIYETSIFIDSPIIFNDHTLTIAILAAVGGLFFIIACFIPRRKIKLKIFIFALSICGFVALGVLCYQFFVLETPAIVTTTL